MIDREAFVSRLILEADTELERGAAYWLQVDAVELAQARAKIAELETKLKESAMPIWGEYR